MTTSELVTTSRLARDRHVTRQAILMAVKRGSLEPAQVLDNGYYLFEPDSSTTPEGGDAA